MNRPIYAVVTFGVPNPNYHKWTFDLAMAKRLAIAAMGSGTCTNARVLKCDSYAQARKADISDQLPVVFEA